MVVTWGTVTFYTVIAPIKLLDHQDQWLAAGYDLKIIIHFWNWQAWWLPGA